MVSDHGVGRICHSVIYSAVTAPQGLTAGCVLYECELLAAL